MATPKYSGESEIPFIPTEAQVDTLIAALEKKTAPFCQLLKETGARPGEIAETTEQHINLNANYKNRSRERQRQPDITNIS